MARLSHTANLFPIQFPVLFYDDILSNNSTNLHKIAESDSNLFHQVHIPLIPDSKFESHMFQISN